jgi:hypothetical protein
VALALAKPEELRPKLDSILARFQGRSFDDALLVEMADVLNVELAPWRASQRIRLAWEGSGIAVQLECEEQPTRVADTCTEAEAKDEWRSRVRDAEASL